MALPLLSGRGSLSSREGSESFHVTSLVLAPVVGLGAAISSAADLIEEEVMLLDVFHEGYKHRSCLGVDPREKPFTSSFAAGALS
ncbi:hypothetical protein TSUD_198710 [Trifolium subterraneum]|uniref:Uncharacterized protein n=1 Tax=Trifolium subterraneum TaxID=3900 RepID=A0A2Z6LMA8_TRISU|nr:hypothetical protein TSUD_198710 [Trifolium subterraneum]